MSSVFPVINGKYDIAGFDTETDGLKYANRPVGLSVAFPGRKGAYLRWGHKDGGNNCTLEQVINWSRQELGRNTTTTFIGLNNVFDLAMMSKVGISLPGKPTEDAGIVCALLNEHEPGYSLEELGQKYVGEVKLSTELDAKCRARYGGGPSHQAQAVNYHRAPGDWVAPYAMQDAWLPMRIWENRRPLLTEQGLDQVYQLELDMLPILVRMHLAGVKVDRLQAKVTQREFQKRYDRAMIEWTKISGGFAVSEKKKMVALFDSLGIQYPYTKPSKTFPHGQPSINKDFLESLNHPIGDLIRKLRQLIHYRDTFIQSYLLDNIDSLDMIHPMFHSVKSQWGGTITGRYSSAGGLNAQNIPSRDEELAPLIRGLFIPISPDHMWLKVDYSQIEYRFFAHYAGGKLRQAYLDNPDQDFHQFVMDLTGLKRKAAKNINFAKLYGAGIEKLAATIGCSIEEAEEFIRIYDTRIPEAKKLYDIAMNRAARRGQITTWGGRTLRFKRFGSRYDGTHKSLNKLLQGSSADLNKMAMRDVSPLLDWETSIMHLTVHDELDFSIPKGDQGLRLAKDIKEVMETYELSVPIKAEAEVGPDWGHTIPLLEAMNK